MSDASPPPPSDRAARLNLESIDLLRGIAALWVTLYHALGFFWRTGHRPVEFGSLQQTVASLAELTLGQGWLGVSLFFVLSGFCIHLPYVRRDRLDVREYAIRRFVRIWVPFAACAPIGFAMLFTQSHALVNSLRVALFHLGFWIWDLHPLAKDESTLPGFGVVWTVVVEVQLYVLYALFWPTLRKIGLPRLTIVFLVIGLAYHIVGEALRQQHAIPNFFLPRVFAVARFGEWLLGAWVADAVVNRRFAHWTPKSSVALIAGGVAIIALLRVIGVRAGFDNYTPETLQSFGFAAIVLGAALLEQRRPGAVDHAEHAFSPLRFGAIAGRRCYSLYLFHFACLAIVGEVAIRMLGGTRSEKDALGGTPTWFAVTLAALIVIAIVTELAYRWIELPSHRLARRLATSHRATPVDPSKSVLRPL